MKNVHKPLAKSVLIPLGLIAAASAADAGIQKKKNQIWKKNIDNFKQEKKDIMKIVKSLEEFGFLIKGASKTV